MNKPLLSIVIANYNYGRFLEEAIQSVAHQEGVEKVELIICDAASTDNSVEIIKKYASGLPPNTSYYDWAASHPTSLIPHPLITWWCSEKDNGQSEAFNKGFSHAKGEWLTWLNADEIYADGVLSALFSLIARKKKAQWIILLSFLLLLTNRLLFNISHHLQVLQWLKNLWNKENTF